MGADAKGVVEIDWGHGQWVPLATFHFYDRSYELFGELNGVRRGLRTRDDRGAMIACEEIAEPLVVEPRGLPKDLTYPVEEALREEHMHCPTWLTFEECELVNATLRRLHGPDETGGTTWPTLLACMRAAAEQCPTRLVFWTDQA